MAKAVIETMYAKAILYFFKTKLLMFQVFFCLILINKIKKVTRDLSLHLLDKHYKVAEIYKMKNKDIEKRG